MLRAKPLRVLVTGAAGFIGRHLVTAFTDARYEVTGIDINDPRDPVDALQFFQGTGQRFDVVVHAAAVVGGRKVVVGSPLDHAANLEIDAALFRWARHDRPGRVIYFSSSCAYPAGARQEFLHEDLISWPPFTAMMPDELYGWTKLTGELLAITARNEGIPVSVVRPFSVYGPGMAEGFAIRGFGRQIARRADPIEIWGDSGQVRDFIHVHDLCTAILLMAENGIDGPVNLGTGRGTSLRDLAVMMADAAGYAPEIKVNADKPAGIPRLVADPARLHEFYTPRVVLDEYFKGVRGVPA